MRKGTTSTGGDCKGVIGSGDGFLGIIVTGGECKSTITTGSD